LNKAKSQRITKEEEKKKKLDQKIINVINEENNKSKNKIAIKILKIQNYINSNFSNYNEDDKFINEDDKFINENVFLKKNNILLKSLNNNIFAKNKYDNENNLIASIKKEYNIRGKLKLINMI